MPRPERSRAARRPHARRALCVWVLAGACPFALGQIYASPPAGGGGGGSIVLSNFATAETPVLLVGAEPQAAAAPPTPAPVADAPLPLRRLPPVAAQWKPLIREVATQVRIEPELLHAVIAAESNFDSRARSPKGAVGLMQLLPATATRFGAKDPFVPRENLLAGASYLKWLMAYFDNDLELVLAAYNAGEQAVIRAGRKVPPYAETLAYVPRVLALLQCARSSACAPG